MDILLEKFDCDWKNFSVFLFFFVFIFFNLEFFYLFIEIDFIKLKGKISEFSREILDIVYLFRILGKK